MLKTIFLYIILHDDNSSGERFRVQMPDMETCIKSIESGKMPVPKSTNDYEVMGVMFCGTENFQRNFNTNWYIDPIKQL